MRTISSPISAYMQAGKRVHLSGIGGVSMCPLARVLRSMGLLVQGSDMNESDNVRQLRELGIPVFHGHAADQVGECDFVVRTAAVRDNNPEIAGAIARGIPVFERAQAWGAIMAQYPNALCIAGTHGKTTTTSMATHILMQAQRDPTVMIGGTLPLLGAGYRVGEGDTIVLESCEYCNSFLYFSPTVAVILNIEEDHLDFFKDLADIQRSFRKFAELVPDDGCVIVNADDANTMQAMEHWTGRLLRFGLSEEAECRAQNIRWHNGCAAFEIWVRGRLYTDVTLSVAGRHNILNALAASAAAYVLGIDGEAVRAGLESFHGAGRRFEYKGSYHGADIYDDYAHHPAELRALLSTARTLGYRRILCAFQPHTYTRTAALFAEFVQELKRADRVVLAEIYAAREENLSGISSADLAKEIPHALYCATLAKTAEALRTLAQEGDLILTVGAGDIYRVGEMLTGEGEA